MDFPIYKRFTPTGYEHGTIVKFSALEEGEYMAGPRKGETNRRILRADHESWEDVTKVEDWLSCLPAPYDELALAAYKAHPMNHFNRTSISDALDYGFEWCETSEGVGFWNGVFQWSKGKGELPPVPATGILKGTPPLVFYTEKSDVILNLLPQKGETPGTAYEYVIAEIGENEIKFHGSSTPKGTKLSNGEFAAKIIDFKPAWVDKTLDFKIRGYAVELKKDCIQVGCKSLSYANFDKIMAELGEVDLPSKINGQSVRVQPASIMTDGYSVTLKELKKIQAEKLEAGR